MNYNPHKGIVEAILGKINDKQPLTKENKIQFRNSLEWLIENEKDKSILAWAYYTRGRVYEGRIPEVCEGETKSK